MESSLEKESKQSSLHQPANTIASALSVYRKEKQGSRKEFAAACRARFSLQNLQIPLPALSCLLKHSTLLASDPYTNISLRRPPAPENSKGLGGTVISSRCLGH